MQLLNNQPLSSPGSLFLRLGAEFTSFGRFITSPVVPVLTNSVGTDGATLTVQAPGTPLDGLALNVPTGAYSNQQTFGISYAPIVAHSFSNSINPVTPLIHMNNGGGLAGQIMTVTIALNLSPDEFALGFVYHEDTAELEGLPFVAWSTNSITIATRHFSDLFVSMIPYDNLSMNVGQRVSPAPRSPSARRAGETHCPTFMVPMQVAANVGAAQERGLELSAGGVDDWEFTNYGSFLAIGGQCSGQSQSAMWDYCERKLKAHASPLYNLYPNSLYSFHTPKVGRNDVLGIKLASRVQKDTDWTSPAYQSVETSPVKDIDTLAAFIYTIWVTHEPQLALTPQNHIG